MCHCKYTMLINSNLLNFIGNGTVFQREKQLALVDKTQFPAS